jgi:hypothetical protein
MLPVILVASIGLTDCIAATRFKFPFVGLQFTIQNEITPKVGGVFAGATAIDTNWIVVAEANHAEVPGRHFAFAINYTDDMYIAVLIENTNRMGFKSISEPGFLRYEKLGIPRNIREQILDLLYRDLFARLERLTGGRQQLKELIDKTYTPDNPLNTEEREIDILTKYGIDILHYCIVDLSKIDAPCKYRQ